MKQTMFRLIIFFLLLNTCAFSQIQKLDSITDTVKDDDFYSSEEDLYIQNWFEQEMELMEFDEDTKSDYYRIVIKYTREMTLFGNSNKTLNPEEFEMRLNGIVEKMNMELKPLLSENQMKIHKRNFEIIMWNISIRKGW